MRKLDEISIKKYGIPSVVLMENAGRGAALRILGLIKKNQKILIICGSGNNGGDGFVVARHLANQGIKVGVIFLGNVKKLTPDAKINYGIIKRMKISINTAKQLKPLLLKSNLIIDGIFGTGLTRPIEGELAEVVESINHSKKPVVSLDIPSGLNGKTGKVMGSAIKAKETVTFGAPKTGFYKNDGPRHAGKITIVDISIPQALF